MEWKSESARRIRRRSIRSVRAPPDPRAARNIPDAPRTTTQAAARNNASQCARLGAAPGIRRTEDRTGDRYARKPSRNCRPADARELEGPGGTSAREHHTLDSLRMIAPREDPLAP